MPFHGNEVVEKVRERRRAGLSIKALHEEFGVNVDSLSRWVRDIPSTHPAFLRARRRELVEKEKFASLVPIDATQEATRVFLSLLYWCEGAKHPASNCLAFTNSDPGLIQTFLRLLRKSFPIDESKFRVIIQMHSHQDYGELSRYWSRISGIPLHQFYRPTITLAGNKRKRRDYMGTCTIKYFNVKLLLNITGIFERFTAIYR